MASNARACYAELAGNNARFSVECGPFAVFAVPPALSQSFSKLSFGLAKRLQGWRNQGNAMGFSSLGLDSSLLENLKGLGYHSPTQVQREAIPAALAGGDLLVSSQTGSGKTAAFVLPGLQRLRTAAKIAGKGPRMLVLAPTRELAAQVQKATHGYCSGQKLATALLVGGMPFGLQLAQVRKPLDIAIATPGRLKDHMDRGSVDLARVELLVLDEADRMLDMGFQEELDS